MQISRFKHKFSKLIRAIISNLFVVVDGVVVRATVSVSYFTQFSIRTHICVYGEEDTGRHANEGKEQGEKEMGTVQR